MAKKKKENIHQLSDKELASDLHDEREKLFKMKYSHSTVPLKNPLVIRAIRRNIARLQTVEHMRKLQNNK